MLRPLLALATLLLALPTVRAADKDGWTDLLSARDLWRGKTDGWAIVGDVALDAKNARRLVAKDGTGVWYNGPRGSARDLLTKASYGDHEVHVEFTIAKGSNSGVKFHGLYEIQINDSAGTKKLWGNSCGGIYPRANLLPTYTYLDKGIAPRVDAARKAGEWQVLKASFRAARFDASGKKVLNARLLKATLNDQLIHEDVELKTPTGHNWTKAELATGPLFLQGDHGPVAFRNVRVRPLPDRK